MPSWRQPVLGAADRRRASERDVPLVDLTTVTTPASLSLDCQSRGEFESRLSSLADVIDKLKVDDSLLPTPATPAEKIVGSLDRLQTALLRGLSQQHHRAIERAVRTLWDVRRTRNAIHHGITRDGGFTAKLRDLGIHDAPPNGAGAWHIIRVRTADALAAIRQELRESLDEAPLS